MKRSQGEEVAYETVIKNIEDAIDDAIATCVQNNDEVALAMWGQIPCVGDIPTPLELLAYLGEKVYGKQLPIHLCNHNSNPLS